ncbi:MAG TPA: winged helix-turn-helix domain-containing protein, partial [Armatimonadota bacterium]|nr:winged helix-turn-helix domain-containing protein [Armatimonadota bacterium]
ELRILREELLRGPRAHGYSTDLWALTRIVQVIKKRFGVQRSVTQVWQIMQQMGFSCQKPSRRAKQRNEEWIAAWQAEEWPRVLGGGAERACHRGFRRREWLLPASERATAATAPPVDGSGVGEPARPELANHTPDSLGALTAQIARGQRRTRRANHGSNLTKHCGLLDLRTTNLQVGVVYQAFPALPQGR